MPLLTGHVLFLVVVVVHCLFQLGDFLPASILYNYKMERLIQLTLEEARGPNQRLLCIIFYLVTQSILLRDCKTICREKCIRNNIAELNVFTLPFSNEN